MISYAHAKQILLEHMPDCGAELCELSAATGRVLREPVRVDRDLPPYDRVMMDGYALRSSDGKLSSVFRVEGVALAGSPAATLSQMPFSCMEVMTGAPLPHGCDVIVPIEFTQVLEDGVIQIQEHAARAPGLHVHRAGSDARSGEIALPRGQRMGSREIGVAASCGAAMVTVARAPRIAIQPTGDELVAVIAQPLSHQIRQSNGHALAAGLAREGFASEVRSVMSDDVTVAEVEALLRGAELILFTGAVSKGKKDFVPHVLAQLGCDCLFHGVAQRPGKPLGVWKFQERTIIIALPGNPVSALMGLHAMVMPALRRAQGQRATPPHLVTLVEAAVTPPGLALHLPVAHVSEGKVRAVPANNSGDFMGLLHSDGWVTIPAGAGLAEVYEFQQWL